MLKNIIMKGVGAAAGVASWAVFSKSTIAGTGTNYAAAVDTSGNCYFAGDATKTDEDGAISKYSADGALLWKRALGTTGSDVANGIAVDSSANVYVVGTLASGVFVAKYNTSGTLQWQRNLTGAGGQGVAVDSSGNCYVTGYVSAATLDVFIVKYNTSGAIQWQRKLDGAAASPDLGYAITTDTSSNVYVSGIASNGSFYNAIIIKYNTSGAIQWQRRLNGSGLGSDTGYSLAVDSSANVYIAGGTVTASGNDIFVAKYDTSGAIQWQRRLYGAGSDYAKSVCVDSSANVYITGLNTNTNGDLFIAKYNTSGTIQWQNKVTSAGNYETGHSIAVDSTGSVYVGGNRHDGTTQGATVFKLPADGTRTGTYGPFTYAAAAMTDVAGSMTDVAGTMTDAAGSMTDSAGSLTSVNLQDLYVIS